MVDGGRRIVEESAEGDWGACDLKGGLAVVAAQEIVDGIQVCVIVSAIRDRNHDRNPAPRCDHFIQKAEKFMCYEFLAQNSIYLCLLANQNTD